MNPGRRTIQQPLVIAHRGASSIMPENTIRAFDQAVALGADGIELDVRLTSDLVPVVVHDENLRRTTGYDGLVGQTSANIVSSLETLNGCDTTQPGRIPTLDAVLQTLSNDDIQLIIEIKTQRRFINKVAGIVVNALQRTPLKRMPIVSTSSVAILAHLKRLYPQLAVAFVSPNRFFSFVASALSANLARVQGIHIRSHALTASMVRETQSRGMHVFAWDITTPNEARRALRLGVNGIIANDVEMALAVRTQFIEESTHGR